MKKDLIIIHTKKNDPDDGYKNTTISLDRESFQIFCDVVGGDQPARNLIRSWMLDNDCCPPPGKSMSRQVQSMMLEYLADLLFMRKQSDEPNPSARRRKIEPRPIADLAGVLEIDPSYSKRIKKIKSSKLIIVSSRLETIWSNKIRLRKLFLEAALRTKELKTYFALQDPAKSRECCERDVSYAVNSIFDTLKKNQWHTPATMTAAFLLDPSNAAVALRSAVDEKIKKKVQIAIKLQGSDPEYGSLVPAFKDEIMKLPNVS